MIFNTWVYGLFLLVAFAIYWLSPWRWRPWVLSLCGCYFYWFYYPPHLLLIMVMTLAVYGLGFVVQPRATPQRRVWFASGVTACIGLLVYYKYQGFFFESLSLVFPSAQRMHAEYADLRALLAISFFTFEYVHEAQMTAGDRALLFVSMPSFYGVE